MFYYFDYIFGVWINGEDGFFFVLVGKLYFGFIDEELKEIDKFVWNNIVNWYGLVCEVVYF